jgi:methylmalonyl-CoA/ethylmalonyl-CoA epimerase
MKLHHVGVVVKELASSGEAYARLLGLVAASEVFHDRIQKVRVQFWRGREGSFVELIEPVGPDSPVWRESQKGGGLNHLCYETSNIEQSIDDSVRQGAMIVRAIASATAFGGRRIAFLYFLELGLIEFVETPTAGNPPDTGWLDAQASLTLAGT